MNFARLAAIWTAVVLLAPGAFGQAPAGKDATANEELPGPAPEHPQERAEGPTLPARELFREHVPGLLVRASYQASVPDALTVRIWDLLVGSGKRSAPLTLPGAAVLTIRSGAGILSIGGRKQEIRLGSSLIVPEGAEIAIDNVRGDKPIAARAILIARP